MKSILPSMFLCSAVMQMAIDLPAEEEEKKPPVLTRIYDVGTITHAISDFPGPSTGVGRDDAASVNPAMLPANPQQPAQEATIQSIADMIRNRIHPASWDPNAGTSIEERAGMLVVMQTPGIHALIAEMLAKFAKDQHRQISIQALIVEVEQDALFPFLGKCGKDFQEEAVRDAIKKGRLKGAPQLTVLNTQRTHVLSGRKAAYLADYDISGDTPDPVVCEAIEGTVLDVRPILSFDANSATVEIRLTSNENLAIDKVEGLESRVLESQPKDNRAKDAPKPEKSAAAALKSVCPIQKAAADTRRLRTSLECKLGRWTLAAVLPAVLKAGEKLAPGKSTLVFLLVDKAE